MCPRTMSIIANRRAEGHVRQGAKARVEANDMRKALKITRRLALLLVIGFVGCTSSKTIARNEGMAQLQQMRSAVQDMNIVVSAGVTKDEYSKRLTDALLKFGEAGETCKQTIARFPTGEQQSTVAEVCRHLSRAMDAYTYAKDYIGPIPDPDDPEILTDELTEKEYSRAKERFPSLEELPVAETNPAGYKFYYRREMVQALWGVASQESEAAGSVTEKLGSM
jgi:hypothetical protein